MLLASGARDGGLRLWDAAGGLVRDVQLWTVRPRTALAWSPSGNLLAGTDAKRLMLIPSEGGELVFRESAGGVSEINSLAYLAEDLLAIGTDAPNNGRSGELRLLGGIRPSNHPAAMNSDVCRPISPMIAGTNGVRAIAVHPATKRLHWIAGLPNTTACVWRSWTITSPNATDVKLSKPASAITVSPDGSAVGIATDWLVKVFEANGKWSAELSGHKGPVKGVGFIHGGRTVVSASWDETVRFWDVATQKETARFPLGIGKLMALAVSPDGTRIAVGGTDGPIVLIDAE
jgi:WD40 repeat protein